MLRSLLLPGSLCVARHLVHVRRLCVYTDETRSRPQRPGLNELRGGWSSDAGVAPTSGLRGMRGHRPCMAGAAERKGRAPCTQPHREPGRRSRGHRARLWTLGTQLGCLGHGTDARSQGTTCLHSENPSWGARPRGHFKSLRAQEDPHEMCTHTAQHWGLGCREPPNPGDPGVQNAMTGRGAPTVWRSVSAGQQRPPGEAVCLGRGLRDSPHSPLFLEFKIISK